MFLFILESIGTAELLLIGLVALIFFGPRKLPEFARTLGKWRNEFRKTTDDFKQTWEKEVSAEVNQFKSEVEKIGNEANVTTFFDESSENTIGQTINVESKALAPEIKEVSQEDFKELISAKSVKAEEVENTVAEKRNWL